MLLGLARGLGELFRRWKQPSITAEIIVGVLLGPTILGRSFPEFQRALFPEEAAQTIMLDTLAWMGILFFLLKSGLETNFATAWRQRRQAAMLSLCDLTIPMLLAFIPCLLLPAHYMGSDGNRLAFSLFIAVIMTISALPVTARVLQDLKVYRTDLGLLIISALTVNDVVGWIIFALILGFFTDAVVGIGGIAFIIAATLSFSALCLIYGPRVFDRALGGMGRLAVPEPAGSLTLVCVVGLLCGAITTWIGIHALFGFFIGGILAGESTRLSERTRNIFAQMVQAILVPLFFASIGLKLDFLGNFDIFLVLFILLIGLAGRYLAAYVGARAIGQPSLHSRLIADAHIPGGEMQIVIGMLALEYGVITQTVYVAVVFGAIITSMMSGPLMERLLRLVERTDWLSYLPVDHIVTTLKAVSRDEAIHKLAQIAAGTTEPERAQDIAAAVLAREAEMTTALEDGVAVPHARLRGLERPVVIFARSPEGLEWNAIDGKPVNLIFLLLTAEEDPHSQLQILRGVADAVGGYRLRERLLAAQDAAEILQLLRRSENRNLPSPAKTDDSGQPPQEQGSANTAGSFSI